MSEHIDAWRKLLDREQLISELFATSLFVLVWELLRDSVVEQVESFFLIGFDTKGFTYSTEYKEKVLSRHRSSLEASLLWLRDMGAINDDDIKTVSALRKYRNKIVHELPEQLYSGKPALDVNMVGQAMGLIRKVDTWFIREVEIPTNPDIDPDSVDLSGVASGRMIVLQLMFEVLAGNEEFVAEVQQVLDNPKEFLRQRAGHGTPVQAASPD